MTMNKGYFFLLLLIWSIVFVSCRSSNSPDWPNNGEINRSDIWGEIHYVANPFDEIMDSVLCLKNVQHLICYTYTDEYFEKVTEILSHYEGHFEQDPAPAPRNNNHIYFHPSSNMLFYPIRNGHFISIVDTVTGNKLDSLQLAVSNNIGSSLVESLTTLFLTWRPTPTDNDSHHIYMGDYVIFNGNDNMIPPFISDSITPKGDIIVCFEGRQGPVLYGKP